MKTSIYAYPSSELALKPEDCKLSCAQEIERALRRLDISFTKKEFDAAFDVYYEALWRK